MEQTQLAGRGWGRVGDAGTAGAPVGIEDACIVAVYCACKTASVGDPCDNLGGIANERHLK